MNKWTYQHREGEVTFKLITSIQKLIGEVEKDYTSWNTKTFPWFRGEPRNIPQPLIPKLLRRKDDKKYLENRLLQHFRMKAPSLGIPYVPSRSYTDQWLFLAQHVGLPTRLLDWTEGLLFALHFAIYTYEDGAVVWMLDPIRLNKLTHSGTNENVFTLTWFSNRRRRLFAQDLLPIFAMSHHLREDIINELNRLSDDELEESKSLEEYGQKLHEEILQDNMGAMNIHRAWTGEGGTKYPVAIHPTNIHPRMSSQASRFTIHGEDERSIEEMDLGYEILTKYVIEDDAIPSIKRELRMMGITHSSLFPELDGLTDELKEVHLT
jgi:hypothetical protein